MDVVLVDTAGLLLIAWIAWYFFLSRRADEAHAQAGRGAQEVLVRIKGGYIPELVHARPGLPLRLRVRREEQSACSEEIVFPDFGIRRRLPAFETTLIELPAAAAGRYGFACGMDMMHGTLLIGEPPAQPAANEAPAAPAASVDPICGMRVDPARAAASRERPDGSRDYFCGLGCARRYDAAHAGTPDVPGGHAG